MSLKQGTLKPPVPDLLLCTDRQTSSFRFYVPTSPLPTRKTRTIPFPNTQRGSCFTPGQFLVLRSFLRSVSPVATTLPLLRLVFSLFALIQDFSFSVHWVSSVESIVPWRCIFSRSLLSFFFFLPVLSFRSYGVKV